MAATTGTKIVKDGLVLNIDAANVGKNAGLTSVEYLIVAGGGGGASDNAGGGGGGGVLTGNSTVTVQNYSVIVGSGGNSSGTANSFQMTNGNNSSVFGLTAVGGGRGAAGQSGSPPVGNGGSGGGGQGEIRQANDFGGTGTPGQGNNGGVGGTNPAVNNSSGNFGGGGGGGAGSSGGNGGSVDGGAGGSGFVSSINGTSRHYGAGGAGGGENGRGGGGGGTFSGGGVALGGSGSTGGTGQANSGGGGGGSSSTSLQGGGGGSGIVVIRYPGPQRAVGGTVTQVGTDTVHTYTTVGNSTFEPFTYANNTAFAAVPDLSTSRTLATAVNGPVYNSDNGGAFVFDGVNDHCLLPNIIFEKPFTINFLCSVTQIKNQGFYSSRTVVGKGISIFALVSNSIRFDTGDDQWTPGYNIPLNENVNLTFVVDENSKKIFVNGILQNSKSFTAQINDISQNIATIGCSQVNGDSFGNFINGKISFFHVYNRALTAQEIAQNFEATRGRYGI